MWKLLCMYHTNVHKIYMRCCDFILHECACKAYVCVSLESYINYGRNIIDKSLHIDARLIHGLKLHVEDVRYAYINKCVNCMHHMSKNKNVCDIKTSYCMNV